MDSVLERKSIESYFTDYGLTVNSQINFPFYAVSAILVSFALVMGKGCIQDSECFLVWMRSLEKGGLEAVRGNYPPLYMLWLWIASHIANLFHIPFTKEWHIKLLTTLPAIFFHLLFLRVVYTYSLEKKQSLQKQHFVLLLSAFHPAILVIGPSFGQVDMLHTYFILLSFLFVIEDKNAFWAPIFIALALKQA